MLTRGKIVKEVMELTRRGEHIVYVEVFCHAFLTYWRYKIVYLMSYTTIYSSNFGWRIIKYWS
jgi:hypothetical protein